MKTKNNTEDWLMEQELKMFTKNHPPRQIGHRGFISMIWNLFKANKCAKSTGRNFEIVIKFPINKWLK